MEVSAMKLKPGLRHRLMGWRGYTRAYSLGRPGQRSFEVWVRWPWQRKWFSEISFTPSLAARVTPLDGTFECGVVSLEVVAFDAERGLTYDDDAGWRTVHSTWVHDAWADQKTRRLKFRIPPTLLAGEGVYQCRIELDEREEVDDGVFAPLTDSYFHVPVPFRLHGSATAVPLIAAGVAAVAAVLSVLGAVVSALAS